MGEYIIAEPARTEDGGFIVSLTLEDGTILAEGVGETYEAALEDAKSKV